MTAPPAAGRGDTDDSGEAGTCRWSQRRCSDPNTMCIVDCAARPAEPPGELREQIAEWLFDFAMRRNGSETRWSDDLAVGPIGDGVYRRLWTEQADALLSGSLAPLLADQAAVKRVEALEPDIGTVYGPAISLRALRRALDGPQ